MASLADCGNCLPLRRGLTHKVNFYILATEKGNFYHYYFLNRKGENKCTVD